MHFLALRTLLFRWKRSAVFPIFAKKSRKDEEKKNAFRRKELLGRVFGTKRGGTLTYSGSSDGRIALVAGGQSSARMVPHLAKEAIVRERKRVGEIGWCVEQCSFTQF